MTPRPPTLIHTYAYREELLIHMLNITADTLSWLAGSSSPPASHVLHTCP